MVVRLSALRTGRLYMATAQDGGKVVSLTYRPPLHGNGTGW